MWILYLTFEQPWPQISVASYTLDEFNPHTPSGTSLVLPTLSAGM